MIIIRNANKDDITTIVNFNSAMALETEIKILNSETVDKDNNIAQKVYSKMGMKESNYLFFEEEWSGV